MEKVTIEILSKEEIKALRKNGVQLTKNMASHMNKVNRIQSALNDELKAVKDYIKETYGVIENAIVTVENRPTDTFNKADFIAVYGEEEYQRFVEKKDKLFVFFHG